MCARASDLSTRREGAWNGVLGRRARGEEQGEKSVVLREERVCCMGSFSCGPRATTLTWAQCRGITVCVCVCVCCSLAQPVEGGASAARREPRRGYLPTQGEGARTRDALQDQRTQTSRRTVMAGWGGEGRLRGLAPMTAPCASAWDNDGCARVIAEAYVPVAASKLPNVPSSRARFRRRAALRLDTFGLRHIPLTFWNWSAFTPCRFS